MSSDSTEQSPFSRPGFVAAAVVVALLLITGGVVAGRLFTGGDDTAATPPPTATGPTTATAPAAGADDAAASICGLEGTETEGSLSTAPDATWAYQGTTAYPTSPEHGPGTTTAAGVHSCFQHTPEGALFAAANALAQPQAGGETTAAWAEYFVGQGTHRAEVLAAASAPASSSSDTRLNIAGFRLLQYADDRATVDLGIRGSSAGTPVTGSFVYRLVWQDGDWKLDTDASESFAFAVIPDLAGYVPWAA